MVMTTVLFLVACGEPEQTRRLAGDPSAEVEGKRSPTKPVIPLSAIGLQQASDEVAWSTEAFTEEAGQQLKRLSAFLTAPGREQT